MIIRCIITGLTAVNLLARTLLFAITKCEPQLEISTRNCPHFRCGKQFVQWEKNIIGNVAGAAYRKANWTVTEIRALRIIYIYILINSACQSSQNFDQANNWTKNCQFWTNCTECGGIGVWKLIALIHFSVSFDFSERGSSGARRYSGHSRGSSQERSVPGGRPSREVP